jgi:hypothetical protein
LPIGALIFSSGKEDITSARLYFSVTGASNLQIYALQFEGITSPSGTAIVDALPIETTGKALAPNVTTGGLEAIRLPQVETLHWGFSIQYSTYYLTSRFTGGPPKKEPLNQFVPLVEFSFDSPRGQNTAATMNPGFAYVAVTWQIAAEAIVPLNREGGSGIGFRAQLLFFLDDLLPSLFGKPLLSDQPNRSLIAWH